MIQFFALLILLLCFAPLRVMAEAPKIVTHTVDLETQGKKLKLFYREVRPVGPEKKVPVVLIHGKFQSGHYWEPTMIFLANNGYRAIAPDLLGFGRSERANLQMSFSELAYSTSKFLEKIGIGSYALVGHSMGGMMAARLALIHPKKVKCLTLVSPAGLEDYRKTHRFVALDELAEREKHVSKDSLREIFKAFYFEWKESYEVFVQDQWTRYTMENRALTEQISAKATQMVFDQPVVYELKELKMPVLFLIGSEDHLSLNGRDILPGLAKLPGDNAGLAKALLPSIHGAKLEVLPRVGHTPHLEVPGTFQTSLKKFLEESNQ